MVGSGAGALLAAVLAPCCSDVGQGVGAFRGFPPIRLSLAPYPVPGSSKSWGRG